MNTNLIKQQRIARIERALRMACENKKVLRLGGKGADYCQNNAETYFLDSEVAERIYQVWYEEKNCQVRAEFNGKEWEVNIDYLPDKPFWEMYFPRKIHFFKARKKKSEEYSVQGIIERTKLSAAKVLEEHGYKEFEYIRK